MKIIPSSPLETKTKRRRRQYNACLYYSWYDNKHSAAPNERCLAFVDNNKAKISSDHYKTMFDC
ncbi:hypothetical protein BD770DRAFT_440334 [Pilaira anomala]|nr:hypothetical protein BD770DRAFT_440334 [Pilaira anomala]